MLAVCMSLHCSLESRDCFQGPRPLFSPRLYPFYNMYATKNLHEIPRFIHRRKHLYVNEKYTDVEFIVGEKDEKITIKAHKLFLTMASPVFEKMFYGSEAKSQPIKIKDVSPVVFEKMINFIYTENWTISDFGFENAFDLCFLAKDYELPELEERCIQILLSKIDVGNACRLYEFALPRLLSRTKTLILTETIYLSILQHENTMNMKESTFLMILEECLVE
uniref:BTB domain-containing protein n=1 Tax=Megaselia scalaris TaxID=36166 RepID=T1GCD2_MEGSC